MSCCNITNPLIQIGEYTKDINKIRIVETSTIEDKLEFCYNNINNFEYSVELNQESEFHFQILKVKINGIYINEPNLEEFIDKKINKIKRLRKFDLLKNKRKNV